MPKHKYTFLGFYSNLPGFRSQGGGYNLLRRDDGKKVRVGRKRFNELYAEGRIILKASESPGRSEAFTVS